jgi:hypothetical protein
MVAEMEEALMEDLEVVLVEVSVETNSFDLFTLFFKKFYNKFRHLFIFLIRI